MKLVKLWVLVLGLGWGLVCWGEQGAEVDPGEGYFQRGQFEDAVRTWKAKSSSLSVEQLLSLATAYQQLGRLREALEVFMKGPKPVVVFDSQNNPSIDKNLRSSEQAQVLMQLGELYLGMRVVDRELLADVTKLPGICSGSKFLLSEGNRERDHADILIEEAEKCLSDSKTLLDKNIEKSGLRLQANLFNSKGNLLVAKAERKKLEPKYKEALAVYHEGEGLSKEASREVLAQKEKAKKEAEEVLKAYEKALTEAYEKALTEAYGKGEQLANYAGDKLLAAKIAVNIVQVLTEQQKCELAETEFHEILPQLMEDLPDSHDKVFTLIGLAAQFTPPFTSLLQSSVDRQKPRCRFSKKEDKRFFVLDQARKVAERLVVEVDKGKKTAGEKTAGEKTAMAYAEGYLAQLYIEQKRYDEAKQLTNQAIFHTQESADSVDLLSAPAQLFRWEWQLGKLFDWQQKGKDAISVYRQAAKHLEITKQRCGGVSRAFLREGEDFYYDYAELLHRQSVANKGYLEELTCVIDSFKTTQLQNYFYSGCPYDIIESTRRLRGSNNRGIMSCFSDEKPLAKTVAVADAGSYSTTATLPSYPFMFASSVIENIGSLLEASHSIMPQFGSIGLSVGLRKQGEYGLLKTQALPADEKEAFKFDAKFFKEHPKTAVLYLFMFDRNPNYKNVALELLTANSPEPVPMCLFPQTDRSCDYFNQVKTNVDKLKDKVNSFRKAICQPDADGKCQLDKLSLDNLGDGRELYQLLIAPFIPHLHRNLQDIDTLVLVPNSVLHTLPFAALQDENGRYLIERYALVVEPTANFVVPENHTSYREVKVLLGGFTGQAVVGGETYQPLDVQSDVNNLQNTFGENNVTKLVDERFVITNMEEQLKKHPVVHLTTHGNFGKDDKQSFLLVRGTEDRVELLTIEKFRHMFINKEDLPLKLITLSACKSALGDEKEAALGLTGVAVGTKIGAVGTLWTVNALATTSLMRKFYEELRQTGTDKAHALKRAQQFVIEHGNQIDQQISNPDRFKHPYYWAAFLLAGNWL